MKKTARALAAVLALCLTLSVSAFASGEPSAAPAAPALPVAEAGTLPAGITFGQVDATHWAGTSLTVLSVEYGPEFTGQGYVDSTLFTAVSRIAYVGGEIDVDYATQTPVLTVGGVQQDIYNAAGKTFTGDVVVTLVDKGDSSPYAGAPFGADKAQSAFGPFYYTAAAYVSGGAYDAAKSASTAQIGGTVTDTQADGVTVDSQGDYFSAFYVKDSNYVINDADITLSGAAGDDFHGWGAGIVALGSANVQVNRSVLYGTGVLRSALFTSDNAVAEVNDSVIITANDDEAVPYDTTDNYAVPMMQQCPFGLGIQGNIRATLAGGAGSNRVNRSLVASNGWAVLSTDSGQSGTDALIARDMVAVVGSASQTPTADDDFTYEVNGQPWYVNVGDYGKESGYIAYADMGVLDHVYNSAWYSPDYLGIITTGTITMAENCYGYSERIGFMCHSGGSGSGHGTLSVSDSAFDVQNIFAVSQAAGTYTTSTTLDNVTVDLAGNGPGMLYLQVNSDDNAGGPGNTSNTLTDLTYEEYLKGDIASGEPGANNSDLTVANSALTGDIFNAATDDPTGLLVTLDNAAVTGSISSAYSYHVDANGQYTGQTVFNQDYYTGTVDGSSGAYDYTMYLRVKALAAPTVNNPTALTLKNGAVWNVTGTNYLTSLTIDATSSVDGQGVTMTVNGVQTPIAAGTYTGVIVVTGPDAAARPAGDAVMEAPAIVPSAASAEVPTAAPAAASVEPAATQSAAVSSEPAAAQPAAGATGEMPPERPADLGPSDEPPGGFGGID